jgi:hypothetical protein
MMEYMTWFCVYTWIIRRRLPYSIKNYFVTHIYDHSKSCAPRSQLVYITCTLIHHDILIICYITFGIREDDLGLGFLGCYTLCGENRRLK